MTGVTRKTYAEALVDGLLGCMEEDPRISLIGSVVLGIGPHAAEMERITRAFPDRIVYPPISEAAIAAMAIGAAMAGERPFVAFGNASFVFEALPGLMNEAPMARYMSGGQVSVPAVFQMLHGPRGGAGAQHSHSPQALLWNCPGLEIVVPASPRDVKGLLRSAIQSDNPTLFFDHPKLLGMEGEVPDGPYEIPLGLAEVKRAGSDVTVVATSLMVQRALEAARQLAAEGIEVEVVDPRTLAPLDEETIFASVNKTGRVVVVDEANLRCGVASELAATIGENCFGALKAPVLRVTRPDVPVPYSPALENFLMVDVEKIVAGVRRTLA